MLLRFLFYLLIFTISQPVHANTARFLCYDALLQKAGYYDVPTGILKAIPTELSFDIDDERVMKSTGYDWSCTTLSWGDPLIYFSCSFVNEKGDLRVSIDLFDRATSRYLSETVGPTDFLSFYGPSEVGEGYEEKVNLPYDECTRKGF